MKTIDWRWFWVDKILVVFFVIMASYMLFVGRERLWVFGIVVESLVIRATIDDIGIVVLLVIDMFDGICETEAIYTGYGDDTFSFIYLQSDKFYYRFILRYGAKGKLRLIIPVCMSPEEIIEFDKPQMEQKIRVYYYKRSKILRRWDAV